MKIVIFAGGTGRRLWPISRKSSPKQFEPIMGSQSTVQLAVDRFLETFPAEDLLISTNEDYVPILRDQLPQLGEDRFIGEPVRRDLAAAVGLAMMHVATRYDPDEVIAIVWGDNFMTNTKNFIAILQAAERLISGDVAKMAFIGETPRFANNNLGWIGLGDRVGELDGVPYYEYQSWSYRPSLDRCEEMFDSGEFVWNTGYFVTTPGYVLAAYRRFQPEMWDQLDEIGMAIDHPDYEEVLHRVYPEFAVESFDDAIVQKLDLSDAVVLHGELGWSDPGTLYALKESVNPDTGANVTRGLVKALESQDCLLYNYEDEKLLAAIGLDGMIVVNTDDAILVVHKDNIPQVKELVNQLTGSELDKYS